MRALRAAINELSAAVAGLREDLADPTGEGRSLRAQAVREANDRAYERETQRLSELVQRR